jgi:hypothetical protein
MGSPAELKKRHLGGTIYEIEVTDVLAAAEALSDAEEVWTPPFSAEPFT